MTMKIKWIASSMNLYFIRDDSNKKEESIGSELLRTCQTNKKHKNIIFLFSQEIIFFK